MSNDQLLRRLDEACDALAAEERAGLVTRPVSESERGRELDEALWSGRIGRETWAFEVRRLERTVERVKMAARTLTGEERQRAFDAIVTASEQPAVRGRDGHYWDGRSRSWVLYQDEYLAATPKMMREWPF